MTFVAASSGNGGGASALSASCAVPALAQAGDVAILTASCERGAVWAISGVTGWTVTTNAADGTQMSAYIARKVLTSGDLSQTITATVDAGRRLAVGVAVYRDVDEAGITVTTNSTTTSTANGSGVNTVTPTAVTPGAADAEVVSAVAWCKQASPWSVTVNSVGNSGTTRVDDHSTAANSNGGVWIADRLISGGASVSQAAPTLVGDTNVRYFSATFALPPKLTTPITSDADLRWAIVTDFPLPIMEGQFPARRSKVRRRLASRLRVITPPWIVTPVQSDLDARWRVTSRVTSDVDLRWLSLTRVNEDADVRWRVLTRVSSDVELRWPVRAVVPSDLDVRWRLAGRVSSDLDVRWGVRGTVLRDSALLWALRARVSTDADLRWRVVGGVQSDVDLQWPVRASIGWDHEIVWRVMTRVSSDVDLRWSISSALTLVQSDLNPLWRVKALALSDADLRWAIVGRVSSDLSVPWSIRDRVTSDAELRWALAGQLVSELELGWGFLVPVSSDAGFLWVIRDAGFLTPGSDMTSAVRLAADMDSRVRPGPA